MKKIILFMMFSLASVSFLFSQNEFGKVGSFWTYNFEPHNGDGTGWTMIEVAKDTMINGVPSKWLKRTRYYDTIMDPPETVIDFLPMHITSDSVFINEELVMDFNMEMTDTLYVNAQFIADLELVVDSITIENIAGVDYKKWHGRRNCINTSEPFGEFVILETVGQVGANYLEWNIDGCIIGGGTHTFICYGNGDFNYPPGVDCEKLMSSTSTFDLAPIKGLKIYPNPVDYILNVSIPETRIEAIEILSLNGVVLWREQSQSFTTKLDLDFLGSGMYLMKIKSDDKVEVKKFVKM